MVLGPASDGSEVELLREELVSADSNSPTCHAG